jgi:hypothetical protein
MLTATAEGEPQQQKVALTVALPLSVVVLEEPQSPVQLAVMQPEEGVKAGIQDGGHLAACASQDVVDVVVHLLKVAEATEGANNNSSSSSSGSGSRNVNRGNRSSRMVSVTWLILKVTCAMQHIFCKSPHSLHV